MQTRELQTLDGIRVPDCKFIVLRINSYHEHPQNLFQQAGIAAITASGTSTRHARALARIRAHVGGYRVQQLPGFEAQTVEQATNGEVGVTGSTAGQKFNGSSAPIGFQDMFSPRFNMELQNEMSRVAIGQGIHETGLLTSTTRIHEAPQPSEVEFELRFDGWTAALLTHVVQAKEHYVLVEDYDAADEVKNAEIALRSSRSARLTSLHNQRTTKVLEDDVHSVKELSARLTTERLVAALIRTAVA